MKFNEMLGEYFFGTNTMREFERERNFYREFSGRPEQTPWAHKVDIQMSHIYEKFHLIVGKWLPTFCEASSLMCYLESKNPRILYISIIASEALRAIDKYSIIKPHFEEVKKMQKDVKASLLENKLEAK